MPIPVSMAESPVPICRGQPLTDDKESIHIESQTYQFSEFEGYPTHAWAKGGELDAGGTLALAHVIVPGELIEVKVGICCLSWASP